MALKKEIIHIIIAVLLMSLLLVFLNYKLYIEKWPNILAASAIIMGISVVTKKIAANILDTKIEHKIWELKRYWITKYAEFKNPLPAGLIFPLLLSVASGGAIRFLAFLQFDSKALPSKAVKKYGYRRYSSVTEWDDAVIIFYSILSLLALAIIANLNIFSAFPLAAVISKYSLIYVLCNLLPISNLDGTKLFFASRPFFIFTWILLALAWAITLI